MFWMLLGYNVTKVCDSPRNSTWFTRPFLIVRGWGFGTRLGLAPGAWSDQSYCRAVFIGKQEQALQSYCSSDVMKFIIQHWQICNPTLWTCDTRPFLLVWARWGLGTRLLLVVNVQRSVKSVRRQSVCTALKAFENVSAVSNRTERGDVVISQDNHMLYLLHYIGAAALSRTHCSRCGLHGIVTLCLLFCFCTRVLALSSSLPSQFLPVWRGDNETASVTTALRMINLRKCTQLYVNRIF